MTNNKKPRLVVKVGTSTLTHGSNNGMNFRTMDRLARVLSDIKNAGWEVILVSSGAIAVGSGKLGMKERPTELRLKQATASVGQCELMHLYDKFFGEYGQTVGQILLVSNDIDDDLHRNNLINTFDSLLELGVIPIVNENDSVSFVEIESQHKVFGDNDNLSAIVAVLCNADLLVLLSDIDGLYDSDPHTNPDARLIAKVPEIDSHIWSVAGGAGSAFGTGGMSTKLEAARLAVENGIEMVITNGSRPENLYDILEKKSVGTRFLPKG